MAAAIGQPINIPVVIRALACDYYRNGQDTVRMALDDEFLRTLDAAADEADPTALVSSYQYQWWNEPHHEGMIILSPDTIEECLEYHNLLTKSRGIVLGRTEKTKYTWCRDFSLDPHGVKIDCIRCRLYRGVAMGILDDLQDLRHHLHGLEVSFEGRSNITTRRAAGFQALHEAAIMKETMNAAENAAKNTAKNTAENAAGITSIRKSGSISTTMVGPSVKSSRLSKGQTKVGQNTSAAVERVRLEATAELTRLKNLPELKWTWGPSLTKTDILELVRTATTARGKIHSGYMESLPESPHGKWSAASPPHTSRTQNFSDIGSDIFELPSLDAEDYPSHFTYPPLRHYWSETSSTPAADPQTQPSSWLHPPPSNYINAPVHAGQQVIDLTTG
jgi:hypothetical protein